MKLHVKSASFSTDNGQTSRLSILTVSSHKTSSQNISITLSQISLKLDEHRDRYWRKKLPWTILEEQFPVPRYIAASKIGNIIISLLWQLRCRCNPGHNKFSSLSNTTVVAFSPNLCLCVVVYLSYTHTHTKTIDILVMKAIRNTTTYTTHFKSNCLNSVIVSLKLFNQFGRWSNSSSW